MSMVHLPGIKGRPACGVRRGIMSAMYDGVRRVQVGNAWGLETSGVTQRDITCRRCLDAMLGIASLSIARQRWRYWVSAALGGNAPEAADGCSYMARVSHDPDVSA